MGGADTRTERSLSAIDFEPVANKSQIGGSMISPSPLEKKTAFNFSKSSENFITNSVLVSANNRKAS